MAQGSGVSASRDLAATTGNASLSLSMAQPGHRVPIKELCMDFVLGFGKKYKGSYNHSYCSSYEAVLWGIGGFGVEG